MNYIIGKPTKHNRSHFMNRLRLKKSDVFEYFRNRIE